MSKHYTSSRDSMHRNASAACGGTTRGSRSTGRPSRASSPTRTEISVISTQPGIWKVEGRSRLTMRILLTGASSFTGYWFVRELIAAGHDVVAAFRSDGNYDGVRAQRTKLVRGLCETRFGCPFGSAAFLDVVRGAAGG